MDKFQNLAFTSQVAAVIIGAPSGEFEIVSLSEPGPVTPNPTWPQCRFVGVLGIGFDGSLMSALNEPLDVDTSAELAQRFLQYARSRTQSDTLTFLRGKFARAHDWLERLWSLPDPRSEVN
jgi:hypothetical protein